MAVYSCTRLVFPSIQSLYSLYTVLDILVWLDLNIPIAVQTDECCSFIASLLLVVAVDHASDLLRDVKSNTKKKRLIQFLHAIFTPHAGQSADQVRTAQA